MIAAIMLAAAWLVAQSPVEPEGVLIPQPWPQAFHDAQRTSRAIVRGPSEFAAQTVFELGFEPMTSVPIVTRSGRILATASYCTYWTPDGCFGFYSTLISFNARGRWRFVPQDFSIQYGGTPAVGDDGTIYVSCSTGICALTADGRTQWTFSGATGSPLLSRGVIFANNSATLYALDLQGNLLWSKAFPERPFTGLTLADDGTMYYGTTTQYALVALDANGNFKWRYPVQYQMHGLPSVASDGTIYAASGQLYALRPDGTLKWSFSSPGTSLSGAPAIATDGTVYITTYGSVVALNPDDGSQKWSYNVSHAGLGVLLDREGSAYFHDGSGITALTSSGVLKWRRPTDQFTLDFATGFALSLDGTLIALRGPYGMSIGPSAVGP